jgi:RNase P/RNase MRP subunit p29
VLDPQGEDPPVCLVVRVDGEPLVGRVERRTETGS